jgi:hypothetical protein
VSITAVSLLRHSKGTRNGPRTYSRYRVKSRFSPHHPDIPGARLRHTRAWARAVSQEFCGKAVPRERGIAGRRLHPFMRLHTGGISRG